MNIDFGVWASIALMHFVAVISPGPDFAIILKQSLQKGLRPALWTSFGIGVGILLHVIYSILGLSLIIKTTPWLYTGLLYVAAAYFIWIGISGLRSKAQANTASENVPLLAEGSSAEQQSPSNNDGNQSSASALKAFGLGFLTNGLNPKATLFFLALFTAAIPAETTLITKGFYGIYLALATGIWFCFLSYITNFTQVRKAYQHHGYWFDRAMGLVLIAMAIFLLL